MGSIGKYGNASGFWAAGILSLRPGCLSFIGSSFNLRHSSMRTACIARYLNRLGFRSATGLWNFERLLAAHLGAVCGTSFLSCELRQFLDRNANARLVNHECPFTLKSMASFICHAEHRLSSINDHIVMASQRDAQSLSRCWH